MKLGSEQNRLYCTELPSLIFRIIALEAEIRGKDGEHVKQRIMYIRNMVNNLLDHAEQFFCSDCNRDGNDRY